MNRQTLLETLLAAMEFLENHALERYLYVVMVVKEKEYEIRLADKQSLSKENWKINQRRHEEFELMTASQLLDKMISLDLNLDLFSVHVMNTIGSQLYLAHLILDKANKHIGSTMVDKLIEANKDFVSVLANTINNMIDVKKQPQLKTVKGGDLNSSPKTGHLRLVKE